MKIVVAGGSGWLGSAFCTSLCEDGHDVVVLARAQPRSRSQEKARWVRWDGRTVGDWAREIDGAGAVVNFSGQPIASGRWNDRVKRALWSSRTDPTAALVSAIGQADNRPSVLVNASAVGYYGDRGDDVLTESDSGGQDFLARLVADWERIAQGATSLGVRVCLMRIGIVFGPKGGVLPNLSLPFRFFLGGHIGSGRQWVSWVHIDDVVAAFRFAIDRPAITGPINVTAPESVTNRQLAQTLAAVLKRPSWVPVPAFAVRLGLGELAETLLGGQRAIPEVALGHGYEFRQPLLASALRASLSGAA